MAARAVWKVGDALAVLKRIPTREELLRYSEQQLLALCGELRAFLVDSVSRTGGHLASNLGVVELTLAMHLVFDSAVDRLLFDVGHQSYVHKLLTGRIQQFGHLRGYGGLAGFPKPSESEHDAFIAGHASDAVSVALGMARARTRLGADYQVAALVGDGAMTGGLCYEGLNDAGASGEPLIVILNDNGMSITPNVGGLSRHLKLIRAKPGYFGIKMAYRRCTQKIPGGKALYGLTHRLKNYLKRRLVGVTMFEEMGFSYIGPVDGRDIKRLTELLKYAKDLRCPVLLHVITKKGCGYPPAEREPDRFHSVPPFDPATGTTPPPKPDAFSATFGETMRRLAAEEPRVCAVTAAMQPGTGLDAFAADFPDRLFDVGIAEGHAVSMAAGLAKQGMIPVVAVYSTFLQRAYDMLLHDVGLLGLHVVLAVDRAGLVGEDGETHHGVFDVGYLRQIPGLRLLCPANQAELRQMLRRAVLELNCPVAIRYPKGGDGPYQSAGGGPVLREGRDITLLSYGTTINFLLEAAERLALDGVQAEVVKLDEIKPLDVDTVAASVTKTGRLFVAEEAGDAGCVANELFSALTLRGVPCRVGKANLGDAYTTHGKPECLRRETGLDCEGLLKIIREVMRHEA